MSAQKGLGKGLGALLGDFSAPAAANPGQVQTLSIYKVEPNPLQPRRQFSDEALQALADSIAVHGILQPLTVREMPGGYYQIIAGERRWRAARLAGLSEVPALIIEADDRKAMELALIENLQRQDLNPIEEALGYEALVREHGLTQEQAAQRVGKSRSAVANSLRLLALEDSVRQLVEEGSLSAGHARAIVALPTPELQRSAAQKVQALNLSVRQTETLCKRLAKEAQETQTPQPAQPLQVDYVAECERELSRRLGRGVKIINGRKKGRFELEFYGEEDLQRLYEALQSLPVEGGTT